MCNPRTPSASSFQWTLRPSSPTHQSPLRLKSIRLPQCPCLVQDGHKPLLGARDVAHLVTVSLSAARLPFHRAQVLTLRAAEKIPSHGYTQPVHRHRRTGSGTSEEGPFLLSTGYCEHVLAAGVSVRAFRCCGPVADSARLVVGHRLHNCLTHRLFLSSLSTRMKDSQSPVVTDCTILRWWSSCLGSLRFNPQGRRDEPEFCLSLPGGGARWASPVQCVISAVTAMCSSSFGQASSNPSSPANSTSTLPSSMRCSAGTTTTKPSATVSAARCRLPTTNFPAEQRRLPDEDHFTAALEWAANAQAAEGEAISKAEVP